MVVQCVGIFSVNWRVVNTVGFRQTDVARIKINGLLEAACSMASASHSVVSQGYLSCSESIKSISSTMQKK